MNSAIQRRNMVDSQVRPSDVTDRRIARAMLEIPREAFVPASRQATAYMDGNIWASEDGIRPGRMLLAPRTLAKLIQHLELGDRAVVLDVAPASGYSTAVLSRMAAKVVALESDPGLAARAKAALAGNNCANTEVVVGALGEGVADRGPYDAILLGGKVSAVPATLLNQLKDGGRLLAILDIAGMGKAVEWRRFAMNFDSRPLFDAEAPMLPGFERKAEFTL